MDVLKVAPHRDFSSFVDLLLEHFEIHVYKYVTHLSDYTFYHVVLLERGA